MRTTAEGAHFLKCLVHKVVALMRPRPAKPAAAGVQPNRLGASKVISA